MTPTTVHSYVREVYRLSCTLVPAPIGPSPRTWGLPPIEHKGPVSFRSIPTCVGFASAPPWSCPLHSVHPHVRGVYLTLPGQKPCAYGPSLRVWGLLLRPPHFLSLQRSIPTCVGVTVLALLMMPFPYGPSPPMRGLLLMSKVHGSQPRSIPTHAGLH